MCCLGGCGGGKSVVESEDFGKDVRIEELGCDDNWWMRSGRDNAGGGRRG
jgi:hypothetical protein